MLTAAALMLLIVVMMSTALAFMLIIMMVMVTATTFMLFMFVVMSTSALMLLVLMIMAAAAAAFTFLIMEKCNKCIEYIRSSLGFLVGTIEVIPIESSPKNAVVDCCILFSLQVPQLLLDLVPYLKTASIPSSCNALCVNKVCVDWICLSHGLVDVVPLGTVESFCNVPELTLPECTVLNWILVVLLPVPSCYPLKELWL